MNQDRLRLLLRQYFNDSISKADCLELLNHLDKNPNEVAGFIDETLPDLSAGEVFSDDRAAAVLNRIKADARFRREAKVVKFYQKRWLQVAAMLIVVLGVYLLVVNKTQDAEKNTIAVVPAKPIVPGGSKATLTMANGNVVVLDNAANGIIADDGAARVIKAANGEIVYKAGDNAAGKPLAYNTLTTPRGGEYQVTLPDGTKVWLNAASSLSYPERFDGTERHVKLTGEAYFEVAKNKEKPFFVEVNKVTVKVLGTHFNVNAYNDENEITTTLLEGAVQVTKNNAHKVLTPGQQAVISNGSNNIQVSAANADDAIAWKNGYFTFNDDDIAGIMKKVSRWYDVEVEYRSSRTDQKFGGTFYRSKSITELLHHLEKVGNIHFKISGRRIIVMD
ncbi:hypothetical protein DJ568_14915 [Mucilaginibacter hurinus]|uniref:Anti-sigma factor n=1 Tax=Mucilaginibacter hurinus TaxID=2201324 RepID=A0A367GK29_9SPHI|nr:FecR family protein [Mucilaginibacter hurinus]RCH53834.1 hypothetical protein DJ568_14915 [Mucilaginibacter hurinus]